jgi:hypothetical protein
MRIRPYPAWVLLAVLLIVSAWRSADWFRREHALLWRGSPRWVLLGRLTTEELARGVAHRYGELAHDLAGERDVGYFSERPSSTLWSDSSPEGHDRIERYYMAQGMLPPSILRLDERWPKNVVDCNTDAQARNVVARKRLTVIRDYGAGLVLARAGH